MHSTHTATLPIPTLPTTAGQSHLFPDLKTGPLLSIGQLCDFGCFVMFTLTQMLVFNKKFEHIMTGERKKSTGLWYVPLPIPTVPTPPDTPLPFKFSKLKIPQNHSTTFKNKIPQHYQYQEHQPTSINSANGIIRQDTLTSDLCAFHHTALFSPAPSTLLAALNNGFLDTFPGLTPHVVKKYLPPSEATAKGHLDQDRQNVQSTRTKQKQKLIPDDFTIKRDTDNPKNLRTNNIMCTMFELTKKSYFDLTGKFPYTSSRGFKYIFVLYDYDGNAIITELMKSRSNEEYLRAYKVVTKHLTSVGLHPQFQMMDNECSKALQQAMTNQDVTFQIAPPHMHRRNAAERAIRTFKNHLIAGLSSLDPNFPLFLWDRLIFQATITLNMLRPSRINPQLSAYQLLYGNFNYMKTPLAPPGIKCQGHEKPSNRASFAPHSSDGWYVGPALKHYRCYELYMPATAATRIFDVVQFFPHRLKMPKTSSLDKATQCVIDLIELLKSPAPASPFPQFGDEKLEAIHKLADIFKVNLKPSTAQAPQVDPGPSPRVNPSPSPRVPTTPLQLPTPVTATHQPVPTPYSTYTGTNADVGPHRHRYNTRLQQAITQSSLQAHSISRVYHHHANPVIDPATGRSLEYRHLIANPTTRATWLKAMANEIGRLAQGVGGRIEGTNTFTFVNISDIPSNKFATYARIVSEIRPQKDDPHRVRMTAGGNLIQYPGEVSTPSADLTTTKLLFNSVVSTPGAKFMTIDIKNMYLMSDMPTPEYMRIPIDLVPPEIMDEYKLHDKIHNKHVYCRIDKGMYGLPQAGKLAHDKLKTHLKKFGYQPCRLTPGLWKHNTRNIQFTLVVDDFGVKYTHQQDAIHLIKALREIYDLHLDWTGKLYIGITLDWDYVHRTVDLSMPNYVREALHKFQHHSPLLAQDSPHEWTKPAYGQKIQYTAPPDLLPVLSTADTTRIQQIVGTFLYYARAVDPTMLVALNDIGASQSKPTANTAKRIAHFLDYAATHPDSMIRYSASDMTLHIHSDASYLSAPKARSRVGGHFFLSAASPNPLKPPVNTPDNGPVHTECKTIRNVLASAAEAELAGLFHNGQMAIALRHALLELGHPQPPTPIQTDNSTACGIVTSSIRQRKSKSMDMRFYWVQDRVNQGHFIVYWAPGKNNKGDYFTKHFPPSHHIHMRPVYLHQASNTQAYTHMQGCISPSVLPYDSTCAHNPMRIEHTLDRLQCLINLLMTS
jgi:hypothetical protein